MKTNMRLKLARIERGLTQQQLADAIGKTQKDYSLRENGKIAFREDEISKICEVLEMEVTDIFFTQ
jgi:putative transcriptional regulator